MSGIVEPPEVYPKPHSGLFGGVPHDDASACIIFDHLKLMHVSFNLHSRPEHVDCPHIMLKRDQTNACSCEGVRASASAAGSRGWHYHSVVDSGLVGTSLGGYHGSRRLSGDI